MPHLQAESGARLPPGARKQLSCLLILWSRNMREYVLVPKSYRVVAFHKAVTEQ